MNIQRLEIQEWKEEALKACDMIETLDERTREIVETIPEDKIQDLLPWAERLADVADGILQTIKQAES